MIELPTGLHPACYPLVWLLGRWEGAGVGGYPTVESFQFGQEVEFAYVPDKPYLVYSSRSWRLDDDGQQVAPLARESGYWRPQPDPPEGADLGDGPGPFTGVEVVLSHPTGFVEIYLGLVRPARVDLVTRGVLRTETAKDYRAGSRLYGLVESRLLWTFDMAAMSHPMGSHLSAELIRTASADEVRL